MIGKVLWFSVEKGFGFIAPEPGGADIFVHATEVEAAGIGPLQEGQRIMFDTEIGRRSGKPQATNLIAV
jgi:CspA family cold shock protein